MVEGSGMICPKCGAENADYSFYCGSCAASLRNAPPDDSAGRQRLQIERSDPDLAAEHRNQLKKSMRRSAMVFGALAALWLLLGIPSLTDWALDYESVRNLVFSGLFAFISFYFYRISTNDEALSFFRLGGWMGRVRAEVPGLNLNGLIVVLAVLATGVIIGALSFDRAGSAIIYMALISAIPVSLLLVMLRWPPKVAIEDVGICVGYPSRNRLFISFDKISTIELRKKTLRVSLSKRRLFDLKTQRFLLWGDVEDFRGILERVAPSGIPHRIPASPLQEDAKPVEPEILFKGRDLTRLSLAGAALIVAGLLAFMNGAILFAVEDHFVTLGSTPLFYCGGFEILCGVIAILGGVQTIRGVSYRLSVAASIFAILSIGGLVVSPALGIIALVTIYRNRENFMN